MNTQEDQTTVTINTDNSGEKVAVLKEKISEAQIKVQAAISAIDDVMITVHNTAKEDLLQVTKDINNYVDVSFTQLNTEAKNLYVKLSKSKEELQSEFTTTIKTVTSNVESKTTGFWSTVKNLFSKEKITTVNVDNSDIINK